MINMAEAKLSTRDVFSVIQIISIIAGAVSVVGNVSNKTQLVSQTVDSLKESVSSNVQSLQTSLFDLKTVIRDLNVSSVDSLNRITALEARMKVVEGGALLALNEMKTMQANHSSMRLELEVLKKEKR